MVLVRQETLGYCSSCSFKEHVCLLYIFSNLFSGFSVYRWAGEGGSGMGRGGDNFYTVRGCLAAGVQGKEPTTTTTTTAAAATTTNNKTTATTI